jgi:hypothetical protein
MREATTAPHPHSVDRVDDRTRRDLGPEERGERHPLRDGTDDETPPRFAIMNKTRKPVISVHVK